MRESSGVRRWSLPCTLRSRRHGLRVFGLGAAALGLAGWEGWLRQHNVEILQFIDDAVDLSGLALGPAVGCGRGRS